MQPDTIVLAYVHNHTVDEEWARSVALAFGYPDNKLIGASASANPRHESARNASIEGFLAGEGEWMLWIDTDQVFEYDAPARLRQTANDAGVAMAGGITYVYKRHSGEVTTNGWTWSDDEESFQDLHIKTRGNKYLIAGTGAAFVLIHREVLEWHAATYENPWHKSWDSHYYTGKYMGHDLAFFFDTIVQGPYELVWDTSIESEHKKSFLLGWDMYARANENLWNAEGPPTSDGPTASFNKDS